MNLNQSGKIAAKSLSVFLFTIVLMVTGCGSCSQPKVTGIEPKSQKSEIDQSEKKVLQPMKDPSMSSQPRKVRPSALAGSWYSSSPSELRANIQGYLEKAGRVESQKPMALIVPHAGHYYSGQTAAYAYAAIKGNSYRRVFILAPNHTVHLYGAAVPSATHFQTPLGELPVDTEVTTALAKEKNVSQNDSPHALEHAIEIQLPFIQVALAPEYRIVPIVVGENTPAEAKKLAEALRPFISSEDLVIISSDFTHYGFRFGYTPFTDNLAENLKKLDFGALEEIKKLSFEGFAAYKKKTDISVCGFHPILVLLALLPQKSKVQLLRYDTSGAMEGDYSNSVSYLSISATGPGWTESAYATVKLPKVISEGGPNVLSEVEQQIAVKLARAAVEKYVRKGETLLPEEFGVQLTAPFNEKYGVFVTLKKDGMLRGCIGNIWPVATLINGLIGRAADAATHDHRFQPVTPGELDQLEVEVSVLTKPERVESYREIEIGRHGMVITKNGRSAVYLPQVAPEQGWNLEQTLSSLSLKAGLPQDAWRQAAQFEVFEAQVFREARE
ncbi:MAG: AmmeMemoRadiSam system protein B [Deltaproteobacteria bacterium]|nr:AmmeMemoRadiSam system protein B [Deltaproteobacteria bacterium]